MAIRIQLLAIVASIGLIGLIVWLMRRRKLREEYGLVWLGGAAVLILFSVWRDLLDQLAVTIGVYYAPAALLLIAIFFGVLISLHFSVVISRQAEQIKLLTQELALLRQRLEEQGNR